MLALTASPIVADHQLMHRGISMSGSPRLNSTTAEAASYWHKEVVRRTRCAPILSSANNTLLADCLLSLNASEIEHSMPPDWDTGGFGFSVFARTFKYAPLLLVDGCVLPFSYLKTFDNSQSNHSNQFYHSNHSYHSNRIPLMVGVTRQESDFSPQDDVRNMSVAAFSNFIVSKIQPWYGTSFANKVVDLYINATTTNTATDQYFDPQRIYSEIVTDATILCPNAYLAAKWQSASSNALYFYVTTQRLQNPFCVLQPFNAFRPPYCPLYSFHAVDMFSWIAPAFDEDKFNYTFTKRDSDFGQRIQSRFVEFANNGSVQSWKNFSSPTPSGSFRVDGLPLQYQVVDMKTDDESVRNLFADRCSFWLKHKFYETKGLIN